MLPERSLALSTAFDNIFVLLLRSCFLTSELHHLSLHLPCELSSQPHFHRHSLVVNGVVVLELQVSQREVGVTLGAPASDLLQLNLSVNKTGTYETGTDVRISAFSFNQFRQRQHATTHHATTYHALTYVVTLSHAFNSFRI